MDVKRLIQNIRDGRHESHSYIARRTLTHSEFLLLLQYINSEKCAESDPELKKYFTQKLRYEYTPSRKEFLIRMSSFMHDGLAAEIGADISHWLRNIQDGSICSDQNTIDIAEKICIYGSAEMALPEVTKPTGRKGADKAYRHLQCNFPGLVIEVAWSQRDLDLPQLAEDYIVGSGGEIGTVIGVNIHDIYNESKGKELDNSLTKATATFTVWKAKFTDPGRGVTVVPVAEDKEWRLTGGKINESVALELTLRDFVCDGLASSFKAIENPRLSISSKRLCRHYERAKSGHLKEVARQVEKKEKARREKEVEEAATKKDQVQENDQISLKRKRRGSIVRDAMDTIEQLGRSGPGTSENEARDGSIGSRLRKSVRRVGISGRGEIGDDPEGSGSRSGMGSQRRSRRLIGRNTS